MFQSNQKISRQMDELYNAIGRPPKMVVVGEKQMKEIREYFATLPSFPNEKINAHNTILGLQIHVSPTIDGVFVLPPDIEI